MTDPRYWIAFNLVPHIGPAKVQRLLERFGDLKTAWHASHFDLAVAGLDKRAYDSLIETRKTINLDAELEKIERANVQVLTLEEPTYLRLLKYSARADFARCQRQNNFR